MHTGSYCRVPGREEARVEAGGAGGNDLFINIMSNTVSVPVICFGSDSHKVLLILRY
jgi:hypothetical protein